MTDDEWRALCGRYKGDDLHALLAACGLKFEQSSEPCEPSVPSVHWPIAFERPCYEHPVKAAMHPPLTDAERAMLADVDAKLLAQRPPWPEPSANERQARLQWEQEKLIATWGSREAAIRHQRRQCVRYAVKRLRAGGAWVSHRSLGNVRSDGVAALRELGHERLADMLAWAGRGSAQQAVQP